MGAVQRLNARLVNHSPLTQKSDVVVVEVEEEFASRGGGYDLVHGATIRRSPL